MPKGPDFLGIGPGKTGTTWIYHVLARHPDVWMPVDKEIRHLWARYHLGPDSLRRKLFDPHWHYAQKRSLIAERLGIHFRAACRCRLKWKDLTGDLSHFFSNHTDEWYLRQFPDDKVSGDITPCYNDVPASEVARIRKLLPHAKVIASFRNPVERDWSHAKMVLCKHTSRPIEQVPREQFEQRCMRFKHRYDQIWRDWYEQFQDDFLLVFYDELEEEPVGLYKKLCGFLGISEPAQTLIDELGIRSNKGLEGGVPDWLGPKLWAKRRAMVKALAETLPDAPWPRKWIEQMDARFGKPQPAAAASHETS